MIVKKTKKRPSEIAGYSDYPIMYQYFFDVYFYNRFLNTDYKFTNAPKTEEVLECEDELELCKLLGIPVEEDE